MERLTARTGAGTAIMKAEYSNDQIYKSAMRQQVVERLAAYEETGLDPKDIPHGFELAEIYSAIRLLRKYEALGTIDDLTAIAKARGDGRVVVLPCKRGDKVWRICGPKGRKFVAERQVLSVTMYSPGSFSVFTNCSDWLGKTVFLTRADAEAALKGENDGDS